MGLFDVKMILNCSKLTNFASPKHNIDFSSTLQRHPYLICRIGFFDHAFSSDLFVDIFISPLLTANGTES